MTYRFKGHSKNDRRLYRTADEEQMWLLRDPIILFEQKLIERGFFTRKELDEIETQCRSGIEAQAKTALENSKDKLTPEEVESMVYANGEDRE